MRNPWQIIGRIVKRRRPLWQATRLMLSGSADDAVNLCELVALAHFSGIPRITLADFLRRLDASYLQRRVVLHPLLRSYGSGAAGEMAALGALVAVKRPQRILEFGTYDGFSTWHLWANSDQTAQIVTVDLPANTKVKGSSDYDLQGTARRPFLPNDQRVRLIEIDSRQWKPDIEPVDFCFIDAGHTYQCVKNDSQKALLLMNPNGLIVWHDAAPQQPHYRYEVNTYLKELRREGFDIRLVSIGPYDYSGLAVALTE